MSTLVTGEAVPLDLSLARFPSRALALAIDITVQLMLLFGSLLLLGVVVGSVDNALGAAIALTLFVLVLVGLPTLVETLTRGRSLGKLAFGLRVVRDDGGATRFRHALVRALCAFFIDIWMTLGVVGLIASLLSEQGKRVGDHLAGTVVVRERVPVPASVMRTVVLMPAPLAGWAAGADLSRVPDDLALRARQFLGRATRLDAGVRLSTATSLATAIAAFVAPASPPGTPAEAYLAAVVAERSRRAQVVAPLPPPPAGPPRPAPPAAAVPPPAPTDAGFAPPW